MKQNDARSLESALIAIVDASERRASKRGSRGVDTNDSRGLGIRLTGASSTADKVARERRALTMADAEAEARREKRIAAMAHEGPAMLRSSSHDERRATDCVHYSGCLDRFVARYCQRGDAHAHCPDPCPWYRREDMRQDPRVGSSLTYETRIIL